MRNELEISSALDSVDRRMKDVADAEHPLKFIVLTFLKGKREGLLTVREADHGQEWEVYDQLKDALHRDLDNPDFVHTMAMVNAIEWGTEERDSI